MGLSNAFGVTALIIEGVEKLYSSKNKISVRKNENDV
jgi:hypothetical protein